MACCAIGRWRGWRGAIISEKTKLNQTNTMKNTQTKYSTYFANLILENGCGRIIEITAIDEDAARADIAEAFIGVKEIQLGKIR